MPTVTQPPGVGSRRAVGLVLPNNEPGAAAVLSWLPASAEEWGYDSVWVTDHIVGVRAMQGVYGPYWLEALTVLTWAAARTSTLRLGTGILVLPHRHPVLAAKVVSTLDVLSGGRIDLGVGTGWSRVEFRSVGAERLYEARGRASDEILDVMLTCWAGGEVAHQGEFFAFRHIDFAPVPQQRPHPPIWVGGHSGPALRRAAKYADVWHPHDIPPEELRMLGARLDELAGRAIPRSVRIAVTEDDLAGLPDVVDRYTQAGAVRVVIEFRSQPCDVVVRLAERAATALFT